MVESCSNLHAQDWPVHVRRRDSNCLLRAGFQGPESPGAL